MKRIFDPALLDFYLQKYEIPSLFNTPDLAFSLYQFEKGERLDILNPEEYLSFLVNGSIEISANRADGTSYPIGYLDSFTCIGDMELRHAPPRFALSCRLAPPKSFCLTTTAFYVIF